MFTFFVVSTPGLEEFTRREVLGLGMTLTGQEPGGITARGELADIYRANLHLRTASRVLARLGTHFRATDFSTLQQRATRLPWEKFIPPGRPVCLRVTCHKSRLFHSDAVGRTIAAAMAERLGQASPVVGPEAEENENAQLVIVRLMNDQVTVSVDSSGEILHKRGYRQALTRAPLRETLAAAVLMASGWDQSAPLIDPFCGSGTIPIEAALMAKEMAPGARRRFAFMDWPNYDPGTWQQLSELPWKTPGKAIHIQASDRDAGAIRMAQANAERAGVLDLIEFKCQAVSYLDPPPGTGWVVTNPPYGKRVSQGKDLRNLYAQFGNQLREKCTGWHVAVLCSDPVLLGQMGITFTAGLATVNGGIPVKLVNGMVGG